MVSFSSRVDLKLNNVQSVLAKATAGILIITEKLHLLNTSNSLAAAENTKVDPKSILSQTNEMLAVNGDIIALLGNSQQELSTPRQFSLQSAFPKEIALICEAKIPASSMSLGDDTNQVVKQVMEQFRATQNRSSAHSSHIYHPYHTALLQALKGERLSYVFLTRWDFNFCIQSSPLRGHTTETVPTEIGLF